MTSLRKFLSAAVVTSALVLSGCGSSTKSSGDTTATTTTVAGDATTTTAAAATTTSAVATTAPATTVAAVVTTAPATTVAVEGPKVTSMIVPQPVCPGASGLTVKWQVTGSPDRVYLAIDNPDGPYEDYIGNSGTLNVPFTCGDQQVYYIVAIKGSQKDVEQRTRG